MMITEYMMLKAMAYSEKGKRTFPGKGPKTKKDFGEKLRLVWAQLYGRRG